MATAVRPFAALWGPGYPPICMENNLLHLQQDAQIFYKLCMESTKFFPNSADNIIRGYLLINIAGVSHARLIQNIAIPNLPKNLAEGQLLQNTSGYTRLDTLVLSTEGISNSSLLNTPNEIKIDKPREWTIGIETLESCINHVDERLEFLKNEGTKWVENIRQNDPEMFVQWLRVNKDNIQNGRADLASLPDNFTMEDYYSYIKGPFTALA